MPRFQTTIRLTNGSAPPARAPEGRKRTANRASSPDRRSGSEAPPRNRCEQASRTIGTLTRPPAPGPILAGPAHRGASHPDIRDRLPTSVETFQERAHLRPSRQRRNDRNALHVVETERIRRSLAEHSSRMPDVMQISARSSPATAVAQALVRHVERRARPRGSRRCASARARFPARP